MATILCVVAFTSTSKANNMDLSLREVFSKPQNEPGETFYFFIPQIADDKNQYTYVYDTKLDRLLLLPGNKDLINIIEGQEVNPDEWPELLTTFILNVEADTRQGNGGDAPQLKIIELDDSWVKFTLNGRHIVLPRELMVEGWGQKNFPLGEEIVDKTTSLPADYIPDDLVKIPQKWNFHAPDYPKYLRRYVADRIVQMLQNAEEQGIHIRVFSAFRSYDKQRYLYLKAISQYGDKQNRVTKPGHSEHQLGTTVDLCGLDPKTVLSTNFDSTKEGRWLRENAPSFGFYQSYIKENRDQTGYIPEPWHYRFLMQGSGHRNELFHHTE